MYKTEDFPSPFDEAWEASLQVIRDAKWNLTKVSKETGGIEFHLIMDPLTWTETFYVNLSKVDETTTRVMMGRIGLAQPLDWGLARQYIDSFFDNLRNTLKGSR